MITYNIKKKKTYCCLASTFYLFIEWGFKARTTLTTLRSLHNLVPNTVQHHVYEQGYVMAAYDIRIRWVKSSSLISNRMSAEHTLHSGIFTYRYKFEVGNIKPSMNRMGLPLWLLTDLLKQFNKFVQQDWEYYLYRLVLDLRSKRNIQLEHQITADWKAYKMNCIFWGTI